MAVDARSRYELYAAFEPPHLGDTTAIFLEFLRETSERADLRQWNYERSRREPQKAYRLYGALRRLVGPDAACSVMALLDPIGWAEVWPASYQVQPVAAAVNGGDDGSR